MGDHPPEGEVTVSSGYLAVPLALAHAITVIGEGRPLMLRPLVGTVMVRIEAGDSDTIVEMLDRNSNVLLSFTTTRPVSFLKGVSLATESRCPAPLSAWVDPSEYEFYSVG